MNNVKIQKLLYSRQNARSKRTIISNIGGRWLQ